MRNNTSEWPEKKTPYLYVDIRGQYEAVGFNSCHDAFMSVINEKKLVVLPDREELAKYLKGKYAQAVNEIDGIWLKEADVLIDKLKEGE